MIVPPRLSVEDEDDICWTQIDMVEEYEDWCNGWDGTTIELDNEFEEIAHSRGQSVSRFVHEVIVPYALKVIEEHESANNL